MIAEPETSLRQATPEDAPALGALLVSVLPPGDDPAAAARAEIEAVERADARRMALLEREGRAVGALGWWLDHPEPGVALLGFLVVAPGERRKRVGSRALAALLAELREAGARSVRTAVPVSAYAAHAFLRAHGFAEMSIRDHVAMGQAGLSLLLFAREVA